MSTRAKEIDMYRSVVMPMLLALCAVQGQAQEKERSLPSLDALPESVQPEMKTMQNYYKSVDEKIKGARRDRDPFQVTPELRARQGTRQRGITPAPSAPAGLNDSMGSGDLPWRVQAISLGTIPMAVLVRDGGDDNKNRYGKKTQQTVLLRYLQLGDVLELESGRVYRVVHIDRQGVVLLGTGAEQDEVRIQ